MGVVYNSGHEITDEDLERIILGLCLLALDLEARANKANDYGRTQAADLMVTTANNVRSITLSKLMAVRRERNNRKCFVAFVDDHVRPPRD